MREAVLLIGPTGVGKSPLGDLLEARGFRGRRAWHFDFGAWLRRTAAGEVAGLAAAEITFLREVLAGGVLLEDEHFPLAERIYGHFLEARGAAPGDLVVLNGLPRHPGQARSVDGLARVTTLVHLRCTAAEVHARIRSNVGGDRAGRVDDDREAVVRKLELFEERTRPLVAHYRERGAVVVEVQVTGASTPEAAWRAVQ